MMAFRRFIFSAFILALFCLTFSSASRYSRRHGRDAEDANTNVVDALATKDAAKGLGEDQTIGNDGASRQRRACYYDPVYGQVCTAPRCTEYDYYGNCVLSVGRRKRDIEDPNSAPKNVHAVEDQVEFNSEPVYGRRKRDAEDNIEAGYGRRKRDAEDINAASEALGEDKARSNERASRQRRACYCEYGACYCDDTPRCDSRGCVGRKKRFIEDVNAEVVEVETSKDTIEGIDEDQGRSNDGASRQRRACYCDSYDCYCEDAPRCDSRGRCVGRRRRYIEDENADNKDVVVGLNEDEARSARMDAFFEDIVEDESINEDGASRQKRFFTAAHFGNQTRSRTRKPRDIPDIPYETIVKDSLREDEGLFEDSVEDQVGTDEASRQKRSCRRDNRCKRDISYETTDKDSLGEDEARTDNKEVVVGFDEDVARMDADEGLFEDIVEDEVITDDGASRQKRSCTSRIINGRVVQNCVTSCKRQCHKITGECRRVCVGRKKRDIPYETIVEDSLREDEGLFEDQVGTDDEASRQKRSCRRSNRCKRDISYETTDKDSLGEDEARSSESSEEASNVADNGFNEDQARDEASRDKRSLSYDISSSSYKTLSDISSSSSYSSTSGLSYQGSLDSSSRLSSSSSSRSGPSSTDDVTSSSSRSSADGCRLVWVHEEKCDDGFEQQCRDELEDRCETVDKKICKTDNKRECRIEHVQDCSTEYEEQCNTEYKEDCKTENERKCSTSSEKECRIEREQKCDTEHKQECKTDYQRKCSTSYESECETVKDRKCVTEYKEECSTDNHKECKTQHVQECHTEQEQKCETEHSKVCTPKMEKKCSTKHEKMCKKRRVCKDSGHRTYKQISGPSSSSFPDDASADCDWVDSEDCEDIPVEQCHDVVTEHCRDVPLQKCFSVPVQKCKSVPKESCSYVPRKSCSQVPHQRCFDEPRQVCRNVPKEQCTDEPKTTCTNVPQKSCYDVDVEKCNDVPKEKCHNISLRKCKQVPETKCRNVPKQNCVSVPREKCEDEPRTTCTNVPEVKCEHKVVNKCEQVPTKNNCRDEKVSRRICDGEFK